MVEVAAKSRKLSREIATSPLSELRGRIGHEPLNLLVKVEGAIFLEVAYRLERGHIVGQPSLPFGLKERPDSCRPRSGLLDGLKVIAEFGEYRDAWQVSDFGDPDKFDHVGEKARDDLTERPVDLLERVFASPVKERMEGLGRRQPLFGGQFTDVLEDGSLELVPSRENLDRLRLRRCA